jgi:diacylglycerol kinase (ATP)
LRRWYPTVFGWSRQHTGVCSLGLGAQAHVSRVEFATVDAVPFQIDGEVLHLEPNSGLIIDCAPHALATVG